MVAILHECACAAPCDKLLLICLTCMVFVSSRVLFLAITPGAYVRTMVVDTSTASAQVINRSPKRASRRCHWPSLVDSRYNSRTDPGWQFLRATPSRMAPDFTRRTTLGPLTSHLHSSRNRQGCGHGTRSLIIKWSLTTY